MDITEATSMARGAMNDHGLGHWAFTLDRSKNRFGQCRYTTKTISMSEHLIRLNSRDEVLDTILHEIAHALTPGDRHGPGWAAKCREIGARPERCYSGAQVATPPGKWLGECENCGPVAGRHRRPKSVTGWTHGPCGGGAVTFRENHEGWTKNGATLAAVASEQQRETEIKLDPDTQARVNARAAARAAEINRRIGLTK